MGSFELETSDQVQWRAADVTDRPRPARSGSPDIDVEVVAHIADKADVDMFRLVAPGAVGIFEDIGIAAAGDRSQRQLGRRLENGEAGMDFDIAVRQVIEFQIRDHVLGIERAVVVLLVDVFPIITNRLGTF